MCLCVLPCDTHPRPELHLLLTQNDSRQRSLQYSSFLHPLPKANIVRLNEYTHSPDRQVPPLPNPNSTLQVQVMYLWATVTSTSCCDWVYTAAEIKFGASIPQAEMVNMKKWHMWWPLPDKLLLGLDVSGVANYFHLLCCKISILLPPGQGSNDHLTFFSDLVVLYWRYTVTIKLANWKILNISQ